MPDSDASQPREVRSKSDSVDVRIYKYLAPGALLALALLQLFLGRFHDLTPWKGGGFGMFSTVDGPSSRSIRVYLETPDGEIATRLPDWIRNREKYAVSFPARFRLQSIADEVARSHWHYIRGDGWAEDGVRVDPGAEAKGPEEKAEEAEEKPGKRPDREGPAPYPRVSSRRPEAEPRDDRVPIVVKAVRLEVWRNLYDRKTDLITQEKIAEVRAEAPPA